MWRLEPIAAVGYPPCGKNDRNRGGACPPEREQEIGEQPKQRKENPKYLFLHEIANAIRDSESTA